MLFPDRDFFFEKGLPFPSEDLVILCYFIVIGYVVYLPLAYFFGIKTNVVISVFLAVILTTAAFIFQAYAGAFGPGSGRYSSPYALEVVLVFTKCLFLLLYCYIGSFWGVEILKGQFDKLYFLLAWLVVTVGVLASMYIESAMSYKRVLNSHVNTSIEVLSNDFYPIVLEKFEFINAKEDHRINVPFKHTTPDLYPEDLKDKKFSLTQYRSQHNTVIPVGVDSLYFKYYSIVENKWYEDTVPFKGEELKISRKYGQKLFTPGLSFFIRPDIIDIFSQNQHLFYYYDLDHTIPSEEERAQLLGKKFNDVERSSLEKLMRQFEEKVSRYLKPESYKLKYELNLSRYNLEIIDLFNFKYQISEKSAEKYHNNFLPRQIKVSSKENTNFEPFQIFFDEIEITQAAERISDNKQHSIVINISLKPSEIILKTEQKTITLDKNSYKLNVITRPLGRG